MFCSVIIPTIGRSALDRAARSVLEQEFAAGDFELIVVNDSGRPLKEAEWQKSENVSILNTNRRERIFARNSGAAMARGEYLCFLDDDDWLLPGAFLHIWKLAQNNKEAVWLYGGIQIVDEHENCLAEINSGLQGNCFAQIMGGAWAPIQTSFIKTGAFFAVGGFNPQIISTEDLDICRRIALYGDFASAPAPIACLQRGQSWVTSTDYGRAPENTKISRDAVLAEPGPFRRLLESADTSYWYGRMFRVYMSTVTWNLQKRRFLTATSRAFFALGSLLLSGRHILTGEFWQGARADHPPDTLHFVMQEYEQKA